MKGIFFSAFAAGTFAAVNAGDISPQDISELFQSQAASIDWSKVSPEALHMNLNFEEMSSEELQKVAMAFQTLGLIAPEEVQAFKVSLTDPRMRDMLRHVQENWQDTMEKVLSDPAFVQFLHNTGGKLDEVALAQIVGMDGGFKNAIEGSN